MHMEITKQKKNIGFAILVLVLAGAAYYFFAGAPEDEPTLSVVSAGSQEAFASPGVSEVVVILNRLKGFSLETDFFSDPRLRELEDFRTVIPSEPQGRANPFSPADF